MEYKGIFVGLGNPGPEYVNTRHNIGFMCIDFILNLAAERKSMRLEKLFESPQYILWQFYIAKKPYLLLKALTYMNLSGTAVAKVVKKYSIPVQDVFVAHDELDLPFGKMKLKIGGGHNGHNGLASIDECLQSAAYRRLRIGIGRPEQKYDVVNWVLGNFSEQENEHLNELLQASWKGFEISCRKNMQDAIQFINSFGINL